MLMQKTLPLVAIRPAVKGDEPFIFKSWINSFRDSSPSAKHLPRTVYFPGQWKVIDKIFRHAHTLIIHPKEHDDHIIGFITFRGDGGILVLDYIYVKHAFRKMGLAQHLFKNAYQHVHTATDKHWIYTHRTEAARKIERDRAIYNPYLANEVLDEGKESEGDAGAASWEQIPGGGVLS